MRMGNILVYSRVNTESVERSTQMTVVAMKRFLKWKSSGCAKLDVTPGGGGCTGVLAFTVGLLMLGLSYRSAMWSEDCALRSRGPSLG